jgi:probable O-glycosylation ligase (exosortase A-associated)
MKGLIFTYVLTYGGALASLFNPFFGLLIYTCFAIVKPDYMWFWSVPKGNYSRIVAIALLMGWALSGFGNWRFGLARGTVVGLVAYWAWSAMTALMADDQTVAWAFVEALSKIALPFLVGITTIDSVPKLKQLAWVIVLSQGYAAFEFNLSYYSGYNRLYEEGFADMDNNCVAISLVTCTGLAFFLGLHVQSWWQKAVGFGAAALMAHAILFSFSRGGMLALVITGVAAFLLIPKRPSYYVIFALAVALVVRLAGPAVIERFSTTFVEAGQRDESADSRIRLWRACWDSMKKHPFGVGPNHFPLIADRYGFRRGKEAHSVWLQIGAELGFPGLLFLTLFYGSCIVRLWPYTRESQCVSDPWIRHLARMVIASLVGFAVSAQFVSLKTLEAPYLVALIGAGVLKLASQPGSPAGLKQLESGRPTIRQREATAEECGDKFSTCRERSLPTAS